MSFNVPGLAASNPSTVASAMATQAGQYAALASGQPEANAAQTMSAANLNNANATELIPAQTNLTNKEATGKDIANQAAQIDLNSRIGMMKALRTQVAEGQGGNGAAGGTPGVAPTQSIMSGQGPNGQAITTSASPSVSPSAAPNTPTQPPVALNPVPGVNTSTPNAVEVKDGKVVAAGTPGPAGEAPPAPQKIDAKDASQVEAHFANPGAAQPPGLPATMSDNFINAAYQKMLQDPNVDPMAANKYVVDTMTARAELAKKVADAAKAGGDAQTALREAGNNQAYDIAQQYKTDPTGATIKAASSLHLDLTTPKGLAQLDNMARASKSNLEVQEQARKNADTDSEVTFRANENTIAANNSNINAGELEVKRGNLTRENAVAASDMSEKATKAALTTNYTTQLQDNLNLLEGLVKSHSIQTGADGLYIATKDMDPGVRTAIAKQLGVSISSDGLIKADNLISQIKSGITEVRASQSQRGATGSDTRMKLMEDSIAGNALDANKLYQPAFIDSLHAVRGIARGETDINAVANENYNKQARQLSNGAFQPVKPSLQRQTGDGFESDHQTPSTPIVSSRAQYDALPLFSGFVDSSGVYKIKGLK